MKNFLKANYERESWIKFLQNQFLPSDFALRREQFDVDFKSKYIKPNAYWIGDCQSLGDLAIIEIAHSSENDPRIGVSRDAFRLMAEHGLSKALFFFVSDNSNNYRFSLITLDLKLEGKDVKYKFSNPKRFSFFLGEEAKIHTPEEFLFKKGRIKDFDDLQSRFSIEVVNKEFYLEIQRLFYKLVGGKLNQGSKKYDFAPMLNLPSMDDHKIMQEFSVRLVGRLIFCWFLKKKKSDAGIPLMPESILSSNAVKRNFYYNTLEPLFFEILNTPIENRKKDFRNDVFDLIPFLNGGLFDPHMHEEYYRYSPMDKEYKHDFSLKIPDEWFKEFFELLETYNFTIDENTSIDFDLSVDPEMLGRIFENLLAEINPETGNSARKATGSYYTPRPIVEYMVDESLIQYLLTKTNIDETDIRELLDYNIEDTELQKEQKIAVIDALDEIKVLDPACGSGAFPMGILQKMLLILQKVDPESIEWVIRQLDKIPNKLVRKTLEDKLMNENWKYKHKMGIIQNAIYGVDIQPIATEISKLRLFLTLIVDENILDEKKNRNIHPLPNLSFKFVTANTLIGLGKTPALDDWTVRHAYEECVLEMEEVREQYFYEFDKSKKTQLENKLKKIQKKLYDIVIEYQIHSKYFNKLISWNPFEDKTSDWFDSSWMFGIDNNFNIVLGNPPYVSYYSRQAKKIEKTTIAFYQNNYTFLKDNNKKKSINTVMLFLEQAINLISNNSVFTFIIDIGFFEKVYKEIRDFLSNYKPTKIIIDISAFENVNSGQLILFVQKENTDDFKCPIYKDFSKTEIVINKKYLCKDTLSFNEQSFMSNLELDCKKLGDICHISCGLEYGALRDLFTSYEKVNSNYHPVLNGGKNIPEKYLIKYNKATDGYVLFDKQYEESLVLQGKNVSRTGKTVHFISGDESKYIKPKILIRQSAFEIIAAYDNNNFYALRSLFIANLNDTKYSLFDILGILNSKFISSYCLEKGIIRYQKGKQPQIRVSGLKSIPIPKYSYFKKGVFDNIVNNVINYKRLHKSTIEFENQIDIMVYKLYKLTYEEANIVDPELDKVLDELVLNKEDYVKMSVEELAKLAINEELED